MGPWAHGPMSPWARGDFDWLLHPLKMPVDPKGLKQGFSGSAAKGVGFLLASSEGEDASRRSHVPMGPWARGPVGPWAHGPVGHGPMGPWAHGAQILTLLTLSIKPK